MKKAANWGGLRRSKIVFPFCETSAAAFFGSIVGPFWPARAARSVRLVDTIVIQAACASEIMATSTNLRLKIRDANSVYRIFTDPAFAGMELTFYRCSM
jgi:hypothetical protein